MVTEANHQTWTAKDLQPFVNVVLESFGAERVMFGSDYPVCLLAASYQTVFETCQSFLQHLSQTEQDLILGGNAQKFYRLNKSNF